MGKSNILANGELLIGLDKFGQVDDLYYPTIGLTNHTSDPFVHKIGVYTSEKMHWLDNGLWDIKFDYNRKDNERIIIAVNTEIGLQLEFKDAVYNEKSIFLREIKVTNLSNSQQKFQVFFNQQFELYESHRGDTAFYDPDDNVLIHYKGRRIFLANAITRSDNRGLDDYNVGVLDHSQSMGAFKDAEDGLLDRRAIEFGVVDSVFSISLDLNPTATEIIDYWLIAAKSIPESKDLNRYVIEKTPKYLIESSTDYWKAWLYKQSFDFKDLDQNIQWLFYRSLEVIRHCTDKNGGIIASIDADLLKYGRDTYSYVWPRDSAFVLMALSKSGYYEQNHKSFEFFKDIITPEGYFMQKYRPDGSIGSSWHPWVYNGKKEYPIQLDETALIICALFENFQAEKDIEFVENIYNELLLKSTNFLISRIDQTTGIIKPSYDLWEERFATSTFTSCTVYGALRAMENLAKTFGKEDKAEIYKNQAELVQKGIVLNHYDPSRKAYIKAVTVTEGGEIVRDTTLDSSTLYGLFKFKVVELNDDKFEQSLVTFENELQNTGETGGFPRYERDIYFKNEDTGNGNPWIITTLWHAEILMEKARSLEELANTKKVLNWVHKYSSQGGMISEQLNSKTGELLSATPLTWSHAEFVVAVLKYIECYEKLSS
jgi:GH15 family glucan-1,4-alpha-glucosidase